jgi:arginase
MGAGPEALLDAGLAKRLTADSHQVHVRIAELPADVWQSEIKTGFELMRMLSGAVREAAQNGKFPIVLAGNCNTAVGTLAGLGMSSTGVAWFDAHGDFNTPDTTTSGFLDGNAVAIIAGRCWNELARTVPGFAAIADERICLIGTRDLDPLEAQLLEESGIDVIAPSGIESDLPKVLSSIGEHVERIYVHLDLDVLDPATARANHFAVSGGLTLEQVESSLSMIASSLTIAAVTLSAYDPSSDVDSSGAEAAIQLLCSAARLAGRA